MGMSIYNPGDGKRLQIEVCNEVHLVCTFPRNRHLKSKEFDIYLDGFEDALNKIEDIKYERKNTHE
jgi:hypothetical protein